MLLRDRFDRNRRKPATRRQRIGFALFWLLIVAYAYFVSPNAYFNTESHLYLAFSIVDHHSLTIDAYHQRLGDESYWHGHYYTDKAPGLSFLAVPVYAGLEAIFHRRATGYQAYSHMRYAIPRNTAYLRYAITYILVMLPAAVFALLLWLFLGQFLSSGWALLLTAVYGLGTIAYPYSTMFFSHQITAMLLFSSFLLLYYKVRRGTDEPGSWRFAALAGFLAGYAVISEFPTALIACLLAVYLAAIAQRKTSLVGAFALGAAPAIALDLGYNLLAFGQLLSTGYMYVHSTMYQSHSSSLLALVASTVKPPSAWSLWQITFGAYRGLFVVSPVLALFIPGAWFMWRRRDLRPEFWLCVAAAALYFVMDASRGVDQNGWSGGWGVASRHLTSVLPFMIVPLAFGLGNRLFRIAFSLLGAISMGILFMTVATTDQFSFSDPNPLVNEMWPHFMHGDILVNWGYMLGLTGLPSLVPLALLLIGLGGRLLWLYRSSDRPAPVPRAPLVETRS